MIPAVELLHIRKTFGSLIALDDVTLAFTPGRVHGLLGENGAGKSTLMNILYGLSSADAGQIRIGGNPVTISSPREALGSGIGMVHQHFMLAGAMTVLDNVLLGDRREHHWLDRATAGQKLAQLSARLGLAIDPAARVGDLSVGEQQRVEILKALYRDVNVLILDEPTAVLTPAETEQLFIAVDRLRSEGKSVVFISHKLGEVMRICDDLTVLRRGRVVFQGSAAGVESAELSRHMVGREVPAVRLNRRTPGGERPVMLEVNSIAAGPLADVSLHVRGGEILGIAGVDGNGQQELAEAIVGLRRVARGQILLEGRDVTDLSTTERIPLGIAHIPNDRKREGLIATMSVAENIALRRHDRRPFSTAGVVSWKNIRATARDLVGRFDVRTASVESPVGKLSGGNQQKVILARELALAAPKLVVAMNPVRGLDIAAANFVYEQLLQCRARSGAILLIASELDELLGLCDRIGVLYGGRFLMSSFPLEGAAEIGRMMTGASRAGVC